MKVLYWLDIFIVASLLIVMSVKIFLLGTGIRPVLMREVEEFAADKRNLAIMAALAGTLFLLALVISTVGGF